MSERLNKTETTALQLYYSGLSEVEAYKQTHPKATDKTAKGNANNFFKTLRGKLNNTELLDFADLTANRVFKELEKMLNATSTVYFQGKKIADEADNTTRFKALELLTKLIGLESKLESETQTGQDENDKRICIVFNDREEEETGIDYMYRTGSVTEAEYREYKRKQFEESLQNKINRLERQKEQAE